MGLLRYGTPANATALATASWTTGKCGLKPDRVGTGARPAVGPRTASSRRQTAIVTTPANAIWRTAVSRGTRSPRRTSATVTPTEPTNHSAVISQRTPLGGGVSSSATWISTEVLASARGTKMMTRAMARPTRMASDARRRAAPPPRGPRTSERTRWLHGAWSASPGSGASARSPSPAPSPSPARSSSPARPMTFMAGRPYCAGLRVPCPQAVPATP